MVGDVPNVPNLEDFSRRQRLFIEWLATSKYQRNPPTQELLADELGLNRRTLSRWKKLPGLLDASVAVARTMIHDRLPEIYAALSREAEKGSYQHIKLALEVTGEHVDKQAVNLENNITITYVNDWRRNQIAEPAPGPDSGTE